MQSVRRLAVITTVATLLLIAIGGLVRASGAGLGCPDWPRCFGRWIPPTSADELPEELRDQFNVVKCWTEYVNRLVGVTIGFLALATTVQALRKARSERVVVRTVVAALLLIGFQGWLGGQVVGSELAPWMVSTHLFVAVVIVWLLLHATWASFGAVVARSAAGAGPVVASWAATVATTLQLVLGALVRGHVDEAVQSDPTLPRGEWLVHAAPYDILHREAALLVGALVLFTWWKVERSSPSLVLRRVARVNVALLVLQVLAGLVLAYVSMPATAQVIHVSFGTWLSGGLYLQTLVLQQGARAPAAAEEELMTVAAESGT